MAEIKVRIKPWRVPNFVVVEPPAGQRQDGFQESLSLPLREIEASTLSEMCDVFRAGVFAGAGKADPKAGRS